MLMIRFQRIGKKKSPSYRVVVSEKARDTQGRALEILGQYNPVANPKIIELKTDRIKHWLDQGAQASESVHNLLINQGILSGKKQKSVQISNKRRAKIDEKNAAAAEAKKEAGAAAAQADQPAADDPEGQKEAAEAPAEEAKEKAPADAPVEEKAEEPKAEEKAEEPKEEAPAEEKAEEEKPAEEAPAEEKSE